MKRSQKEQNDKNGIKQERIAMRLRLKLAELAQKNRGWNLRRLAEALDVEYQNVLLWNQGRSLPRLSMLLRLSRVLRCRIEALIESKDIEPSDLMANDSIEAEFSPENIATNDSHSKYLTTHRPSTQKSTVELQPLKPSVAPKQRLKQQGLPARVKPGELG